MMRNLVRLGLLLLFAAPASAQGPATVTGRVTGADGATPEAAVLVRIESLNVGASTGADGAYRLVVPSARIRPGQSVTITASRTGLTPVSRTLVLHPDSAVTQDFQMATDVLLLEDIVVTGSAGAVEARKAPFDVGHVTAEDIGVPPTRDGKDGRGRHEAGVLTAGVIDDFGGRGWNEYRRFLRRERQEQQWGVEPWEVLQVRVRNGRQALRDHPVEIQQDGRRFHARTDGDGVVRLFPALAHHRLREGEFTVTPEGGAPQRLSYTRRSFRHGVRPVLEVNQPLAARVRRPVLEIGFMIDATGSMGDEMTYIQTELRDIIARVQPLGAPFDVRIAVVYYRDRRDQFVTRAQPFTDDVDATVAFLAGTQAGGGGDFPEEMNAAFREMMQQGWSDEPAARMLFVVADAPPHEYADATYTYQDALADASRRGIAIFPLASSGIDRPTEYLMRAMAVATGGKYIFLTDDSGIGSPHLTPDTPFQVEPLNDLMVREIRAFAARRFPQVRGLREGRMAANR
ncbi:MAG TPA: VWA domain-containing protein [Longimicrobium sp.]|nr:VWA domain-containing protein [Longimicrobium sp.]